MRSLRAAPIAFVVAGICGGAAVARAAETFVALEYGVVSSTGACPTAAEFRRKVARQLGYDPFRADADRRVSVEITRSAGGLEGRLKWSDGEGRWVGDRRFSSRQTDCVGLAASMMFSAAVQIQLLASLSPPPPASTAPAAAPPSPLAAPRPAAPPRPGAASVNPTDEPTSRPAAPVLRPPTPAPTPAPTPRPPTPAPAEDVPLAHQPPAPTVEAKDVPSVTAIQPASDPARPSPSDTNVVLGAGLGAALAVGVAPGAGALGRLFLDARKGALSLGLAADLTLPVTEQQPDGSAFALDTQAANAIACGHLGVLAACAVGRFGRIHARGAGVDVPRSPAGLFSQLGARLAAAHDIGGRFFAGAHVDGLVMLTPWTVALNRGAVWTTPRFALLLGVDVGARFF